MSESVSNQEQEPTTSELRQVIDRLVERDGLVVDPADVDFLFIDEETAEPRDFDDALGAVYGFLIEGGYDPDELLGEEIFETGA